MSSVRTRLSKVLFAFSAMLLSSTVAAQKAAAATALTANGSAQFLTIDGVFVMLLTPSQQGQAGSVFTTNKVPLGPTYAFTTFFQFKMNDPGSGGASDGMTFIIQAESATTLGANGGNLGYTGITPSIAVKFDTWQDSGDINDNNVAILTNGVLNAIDPQSPYGVTACQPPSGLFGCMNNGDTWSVWIDYDGTYLYVAVADNSVVRPANLISYPIDIPSILGSDSAFVGFSAGTGLGDENHAVFNWLFL